MVLGQATLDWKMTASLCWGKIQLTHCPSRHGTGSDFVITTLAALFYLPHKINGVSFADCAREDVTALVLAASTRLTLSDQKNTTAFKNPNNTKGVERPKRANSQPPPEVPTRMPMAPATPNRPMMAPRRLGSPVHPPGPRC